MRHRVAGKKLNRDKDHRQSLLKNLAISVLLHGKVETSITKAKFVRPFVEKLITKAKTNTYSSLKDLRSKISNEDALRKLFSEIAPQMSERHGGYTRIKRLGVIRKGDNSEMARIEIVSNDITIDSPETTKDKNNFAVLDKAKNTKKKSSAKKTKESLVSEETVNSSNSEANTDSASIVKDEETK